jgi:hypothetical protein
MNATAISKYSSESLAGISIESLERVFPLEVRDVVSRRFKVGNTAGEYTGCGSSPHDIFCSLSSATGLTWFIHRLPKLYGPLLWCMCTGEYKFIAFHSLIHMRIVEIERTGQCSFNPVY